MPRGNLIFFTSAICGGFLVFCWPAGILAATDHLVISQIQISGGPGKTSQDFVELYNPTSATIDVSGWKLRKRTKSGSELSVRVFSAGKAIAAGGYFLWANSDKDFGAGLESNETGTATLADDNSLAFFDEAGNLIDAVAWGVDHQNPFLEGAAFASNPGGGQSLWRQNDASGVPAQDTNNNVADFFIATSSPRHSFVVVTPSLPPATPTPPIPAETSLPAPAAALAPSFSCQNSVIVNELMINPEDSNAEFEFIEIYNPLGQEILLEDWSLEDTQGKTTKYIFSKEAKIPPFGYLALYRPQTKITLNNTGDGVKLTGPNKEFCNATPVNSGAAKENLSYSRVGSGWQWSQTATPGSANDIKVAVAAAETKSGASENTAESAAAAEQDFKNLVILNELFPNPAGPDLENEFIELKNISAEAVDLKGWQLEDANRQKYTFNTSTPLARNGFLVIWRRQFGLSLNNNGETIKLIAPNRQIIDIATYEEAAGEDLSYSRFASSIWQWSKVPTPGVMNVSAPPNRPPIVIFELPNVAMAGEEIIFDASDTIDPENDQLSFLWDFGDKALSAQMIATHTYAKAGNFRIALTVNDHQGNEIKEKAKLLVEDALVGSEEENKEGKKSSSRTAKTGEWRRVEGVVTVLPGQFGSQIFYLQSVDGGWQVYMFKKDFPDLNVGDRVAVSGEITSSGESVRLKIKKKSDIQILGRGGAVEPLALSISDLDEGLLNSLARLTGEVLEPKKSQFYLADDSGEILVQLKSRLNLKGPLAKEGDKVEIIGIVGQSKGVFRIWPRFLADVKVLSLSTGASDKSSTEENKAADKYLSATAGGLTTLLLAFLAKSRGALAKGLAMGVIGRVVFWRKKKE